MVFPWVRKKISAKLSEKRKFSTRSVNQCQGQIFHQFTRKRFSFFLCVSLVYFKWALQFRHFLLEVCQVHQLVIKNICCHSKGWFKKEIWNCRRRWPINHCLNDLLPVKRTRRLRDRANDYVLPHVRIERFKRCFINRYLLTLSRSLICIPLFTC